MRIWRGDLDERDVEGEDLTLEQVRHLAEENRDIVGLAVCDRSTNVCTDKEHAGEEARPQFGFGVGSRSFRVEVDYLDAA